MAERTIPLSPEQAEYLSVLLIDAKKANTAFNIAVNAIVRGHGILTADLVGISKESLTVKVPE